MDSTDVRRTYRGDREEIISAFRRDSAAANRHGWYVVAVDEGDSQLQVTYRQEGPEPPGLRELWRPFAAGILLGALVLVVLVPLLYLASHQ